jgi:hypothetical protein
MLTQMTVFDQDLDRTIVRSEWAAALARLGFGRATETGKQEKTGGKPEL